MKLKIRLAIFIMLVIGVGFACQLTSPRPASWSGTPTAKARALTNTAVVLTQGPFPEQNFVLTPTETPLVNVPTSTPQSTVTPDGPWLVYPAPGGDGLHAYDIEAKNSITINLPEPIYWEDLQNGLSPDGRKLIVRAGSPTETDELSLYKIDLMSEEVRKITPLLSLLLQRKIVNQEGTRAFDVLDVVTRSDGIAWSPDSRYLAFSAALDNQSSDLYIFDDFNNRVSRMNGLSTHNATPTWGLDSSWLISQELGRTSSGETWRAENVTGVNVPEFDNQNTFYLPRGESQEEVFVGWLNNQTFVSYSLTSDGPSTLRRVNVENFDISIIQQSSFDAVAIDPVSHTIAVILGDGSVTAQGKVEGVYLLRPEDIDFKLQRGGLWRDLKWESGGMFIASGSQGLFAFSSDGQNMFLPGEKAGDLSPKGNWMLTWGEGARLYQPPSVYPLQTLTEDNVETVFWQPDSKAFFLQSDGALYYLAFPSLNFQQVEVDLTGRDPLFMAWIAEDVDE
ncbi:MAG: hypothetical protein SVP52_00485 [Chloroflexota bacterium]|nr:hypothetical protein [Chloroflexota bacterium]